MKSTPVRAFIVDDSATSRTLLRRVLATDPRIEVIGEAETGDIALRKIARVKPDIVLMDIVMPGMSGLTATRRLMGECPLPIVLVSELVTTKAELNFKALDLGASILANIVMAGALVGAGVLPLAAKEFELELQESLPADRLDLNLKAFRRGLAEVKAR